MKLLPDPKHVGLGQKRGEGVKTFTKYLDESDNVDKCGQSSPYFKKNLFWLQYDVLWVMLCQSSLWWVICSGGPIPLSCICTDNWISAQIVRYLSNNQDTGIWKSTCQQCSACQPPSNAGRIRKQLINLLYLQTVYHIAHVVRWRIGNCETI